MYTNDAVESKKMTNINNIDSEWEPSGNKVEEVFLKVLANRVHSTRGFWIMV